MTHGRDEPKASLQQTLGNSSSFQTMGWPNLMLYLLYEHIVGKYVRCTYIFFYILFAVPIQQTNIAMEISTFLQYVKDSSIL